ncbi:hypothetical protein [Paraburkholderia largidicola]|uniref:hypothetical protein n=1 Tax=Paraburkholderia largidicola TaxID=3014751 RepID=UPI001FB19D61|nr:hypothetical protein [Paraburkholderia sp. PGU16]
MLLRHPGELTVVRLNGKRMPDVPPFHMLLIANALLLADGHGRQGAPFSSITRFAALNPVVKASSCVSKTRFPSATSPIGVPTGLLGSTVQILTTATYPTGGPYVKSLDTARTDSSCTVTSKPLYEYIFSIDLLPAWQTASRSPSVAWPRFIGLNRNVRHAFGRLALSNVRHPRFIGVVVVPLAPARTWT